MHMLSTLRMFLRTSKISNAITAVPSRNMGGHGPRIFPLQPSRWQWRRFKDLLNLYVMAGLIPVTLIVAYANIFIGPAKLAPIPEDYTPKYWEYHKHPITRWLAKHIFPNPQQEYEKYMHHIFEENEIRLLRKLDFEVKAKIAERRDFQAYYYRPILAKYHRKSREASDYLKSVEGD